ncbi:MAG: phosphoribosylglycinamide formyltransferase [Chloroflexi bacterium]|nr:phosphoribosylglycinamide formyltransferase [Chloroflexota bacterium]
MRLAVLVSGGGTNLQALIAACASGRLDAEIVYVASNHAGVHALERAAAAGIPAGVFEAAQGKGGRSKAQTAMAEAVMAANPDLIVAAGFDRVLYPAVLDHFKGTPIINIHPSLLPAFGGRGMLGDKVHEAVIAAGVAESGCTVHFLEPGMVDGGRILLQRRVPVKPGDDAASLAERVLREEHLAIVDAVAQFATGQG